MHVFNLALFVFGAVTLVLGLSAGIIKNRLYISEPIIAVASGILVGPAALGLFEPEQWGDPVCMLQEISRVTLAIALMTIALQLPDRYLSRSWKSLAVLLVLVMPCMWLFSALMAYWILDLSILTALLLGAIVTPTDPVLASSIVTGKLAEANLPAGLRHLLLAESGANDALAYALVMLPILLNQNHLMGALSQWGFKIILWKIGASIVLGALIGFGAGRLLNWIRKSPAADKTTLLTVSVSLALTVAGSIKLIHAEGLLAVFVAGLVMNRVIIGEFEESKQQLIENLKRFLDIPVFILFGLMLPWQAWYTMGISGIWLCLAILLLRRVPAILLFGSRLRCLRSRKQELFVGWFGPIGIAALYYANLSLAKGQNAIVWTAASLIIFTSIVFHGISATPLTQKIGKKSFSQITAKRSTR